MTINFSNKEKLDNPLLKRQQQKSISKVLVRPSPCVVLSGTEFLSSLSKTKPSVQTNLHSVSNRNLELKPSTVLNHKLENPALIGALSANKCLLRNPLLTSVNKNEKQTSLGSLRTTSAENLGRLDMESLKCLPCQHLYQKRLLLGTSHDKSSLDGPNLTGFNLTIAKSLQSESLTKYEEKKSGPLEETDTSKPEEHIEEVVGESETRKLPSEDKKEFEGEVFPPVKAQKLSNANSITELDSLKRELISFVSEALVNPMKDFNIATNGRVATLVKHLERIADSFDPEFILKLALYSRNHLNLRTISNFLLAFVATNEKTRPFLRRYFNKTINLPTDWIEVAEIYQGLDPRAENSKFGTLSTALRKALIRKFPDFDEYQLGKYNRQKRKKKEKKETKPAVMPRGKRRIISKAKPPPPPRETKEGRKFTLKQLIRMAHISKPVGFVMSILGKRYPDTPEEFQKLGLPGIFASERAGKRMKLAVPETWETQVSARGNKAEVWEELLDHNKLPFMAMLRNLRNMLQAGISEKHHKRVLFKLTDVKTVVRSRQFPFRFFSAFGVIKDMEDKLIKIQEAAVQPVRTKIGKKGTKKVSLKPNLKMQRKQTKAKVLNYTQTQLDTYKKALGQSVKIATHYNLKPIANKTYIICDLRSIWFRPITANAFGMEKTKAEMMALMALMCQHACESAVFVVFHEFGYEIVPISKDNILERATRLLKLVSISIGLDLALLSDGRESKIREISCSRSDDLENLFPMKILNRLITEHRKIDNLIVITEQNVEDNLDSFLLPFRTRYRKLVNRDLLYVEMYVGKAPARNVSQHHKNDIFVSGVSEQVLQYIAEFGNGAQLQHISAIDKAYGLHKIPVFVENVPKAKGSENAEAGIEESSNEEENSFEESPRKSISIRKIRVFISSTFKDMTVERDLIVNHVMPKAREVHAKRDLVMPYEIDLRWGVAAETAHTSSALTVCLAEVQRCDIFVGLMGSRYGSCPKKYAVPMTKPFEWIHDLPSGLSVTELEIRQALHLEKPMLMLVRNDKRDADTMLEAEEDNDIDKQMRLLKLLKSKLSRKFLQVEDYQMVVSVRKLAQLSKEEQMYKMEPFVSRLQNMLSPCISSFKPEATVAKTWIEEQDDSHEKALIMHGGNSIPRKQLHEEIVRAIHRVGNPSQWRVKSESKKDGDDSNNGMPKRYDQYAAANDDNEDAEFGGGIITIKGEQGIGKSMLMSSLVRSFSHPSTRKRRGFFYHFVNAGNGSRNLQCLLQRIYTNLNRDFRISEDIPDRLGDLISGLSKWLQSASTILRSVTSGCLVFMIDGLDDLNGSVDGSASNLDWIPQKLPKGCVFVISVRSRSHLEKLADIRSRESFTIPVLNTNERRDLITTKLALFGKRLDDNAFNNQLSVLVTKRDAAKPLYVAYACEELKRFSVFEKLSVKVKSLPNTLSLLLETMCKTMENDYGSKLVAESLICLFLSPEGLDERDLIRLLSALKTVDNEQNVSFEQALSIFDNGLATIPPLLLAELISSLKVFLGMSSLPKSLDGSETNLRLDDSLVRVGSSLVAASIEQKFLNKADKHSVKTFYHKILAALHVQRVHVAPRSASGGNVRWCLVDRAPYNLILHHLARSGEIGQLKATLTDLTFVKRCFQTHAQYDLLHLLSSEASSMDLPKMMCKDLKACLADDKVKAVFRFVQDNLHVLNRTPELIVQQASFSPVLREAQLSISGEETTSDRILNFDWLNKPETMSPKLFTINDFSVPVESLDVNEEKSLLVVGIKDCRFCVYHTKTGKLVKEVLGLASPVSCVKFADSEKVVIGTDGGQMSMYSVNDWHKIATMNGHERRVSGIARDPSGMTVATVGWDCALKLWNISDGKFESEIDRPAPCPINSVDWHPLRALVAISCWDSTIKLWNLTEKKMIYSYRGHRQSVRAALFTKPEGMHLISSSLDGDLRLWSVVDRCALAVIHSSTSYLSDLCLTQGGKLLVGACGDGRLKVWGTSLGEQRATLLQRSTQLAVEGSRKQQKLVDFVESMAILENSAMLAVGLSNGVIRLYGNWSFLLHELEVHQKPKVVLIDVDGLPGVFYATANKLYAFTVKLGGMDPQACMVQTTDALGKKMTTEYSQASGISHFVVKKGTNDFFFAVGTEMGTVEMLKLKNVGKWKRLVEPPLMESMFKIESAHEGTVTGITFDEKSLITSGRDKFITCWEKRKKDEPPEAVRSVDNAHNDWINCLDAVEGLVVTGSSDNMVKVWNAKCKDKSKDAVIPAMALEFELKGHGYPVVAVKYIPKAELILSCDSGGVLNSWQSTTGTLLSSKECGTGGLQVGTMACWSFNVPISLDEEKPIQGILDWGAEVDKQDELNRQKKKQIKMAAENAVTCKVMVALGHKREVVTIWDALAGELKGNLVGHSNRVNCISKVTEGVFSGANDANIIKWSCTKQLEMESLSSKQHDCCVSAIACYVTEFGTRVLTGDHTGQLAVTDFKSGEQIPMFFSDEDTSNARLHKGVVTGIIVMPPKIKKAVVVTCGMDQDVVLLELEEKQEPGSSNIAIFARVASRTTAKSPIYRMSNFGKWGNLQVDSVVLCCWQGLYIALISRSGVKVEPFQASHLLQWCVDCTVVSGAPSTNSRHACIFMEEPKPHAVVYSYNEATDSDGALTATWNWCYPGSDEAVNGTIVSALDKVRGILWRGNHEGQVVHQSRKERPENVKEKRAVKASSCVEIMDGRKQTVHEGKVTGLEIVGNLMITSGADCFIRVWRITNMEDPEEEPANDSDLKLIQVAEFMTAAPVSSMFVVEHKSSTGPVNIPSGIVAGDTLGNIYCLSFPSAKRALFANSDAIFQ